MVFGPNKNASKLEGSKAFMKKVCEEFNIPSARYKEISNIKEAELALENFNKPFVVKSDGLAAGKGVTICNTKEDAIKDIRDILNGRFGNPIILEKTGNGVGKTQLTDYASNVVRQIQEENGWIVEEESVDTPVEVLDCQTKQTEVTDKEYFGKPEPDIQLSLPDFEINDTTISEWVTATSSILTKVRELQSVQKELQSKDKKIKNLEEVVEQLNTQVSDLTEELNHLKNFYLIQAPKDKTALHELSQKLTALTNEVNNELNR